MGPISRFRFSILQVMAVIAIPALGTVMLPSPYRIPFLIAACAFLFVVFGVTILTGTPWLTAAGWIFACYPLFVLGALYFTWILAWIQLGHRPVIYLDDPKYISDGLAYFRGVVFLLGVGYLLSSFAAAFLFVGQAICYLRIQPEKFLATASLVIVPALVQGFCYLITVSDPGGVLCWFFD